MRQRIHSILIVVDRYLQLMGDKTIPDSAEPRLESFYPPFVAGIDLPHQGVVDSYNPTQLTHLLMMALVTHKAANLRSQSIQSVFPEYSSALYGLTIAKRSW